MINPIKLGAHAYMAPAKIAANQVNKRFGPEYDNWTKGGVLFTQTAMFIAGLHLSFHLLPNVGIKSHTELQPSMASTLVIDETIPMNDCGVYMEAQFDKAKGEVTKKLHSSNKGVWGKVVNTVGDAAPLAKWSEEWTGGVGSLACTVESIRTRPKWDPSAPRRDGGLGAFVVNINAEKDMRLFMFETNPGGGWKSDTGGIFGGLVSAFTDEINGYIPFVHAGYVDKQQNGLRTLVMSMVMNQMATTCGPEGIDLLTHPKDVTADANLPLPQSIQGEMIKSYVDSGNAMLKGIYQRLYPKVWEQMYERDMLTADDFNVNINVPPQGTTAMLSNYTDNYNHMMAKAGSDVSVPMPNSYPKCDVKLSNQNRYLPANNKDSYVARKIPTRSGKK